MSTTDTDPHAADYCVVCGSGPEIGRMMHPVAGIENGCVCEECINE